MDNNVKTDIKTEENETKKNSEATYNSDRVIVSAGYAEQIEHTPEFIPNNPLERPEIKYTKPIIAFSVYVVQFIALALIPYGKWWITTLVLVAYSLIYFAFIAKRTVIWIVHLYQNKASDETRLRCTMEPSCSVYMIMAVEKYGVIRGVCKGINRLFRCGKENRVDYP